MNEGLLQTTINDAAFDQHNFFWISFPNGIQRFDGKNFMDVPLQAGLPDDKWVNFFRCSNGDLLLSHAQGISKYNINKNQFVHVYQSKPGEKIPAQFLGEDENVIYIYADGRIKGFSVTPFQLVSDVSTGIKLISSGNNLIKFSDNIIDHTIAFYYQNNIYLWNLKTQKLLHRPALTSDVSPFFLRLTSPTEFLYFDPATMTLKSYNAGNKKSRIVVGGIKNTNNTFRSHIFSWKGKTIWSLYNRLYGINASFEKQSELVNFQNKPLTDNASISKVRQDNFGNLYLITVNDGIRKILSNNFPIKYYGAEKKDENYTLSLYADKNHNRIVAGTGNGVLLFDTLQQLIKKIKTLPGKGEAFRTYAITRSGNGNYFLFSDGSLVWHLSDQTLVKTPIKITSASPQESGIGYFSNVLLQRKEQSVLHSQGRFFKADYSSNTITEYKGVSGSVMSSILYRNYIITHSNDQLLFLDTVTFEVQKRIPFPNTGGVRCFASDASGKIYIGCNKGIYKLTERGEIIQHLSRATGLPDECIYAIAIDRKGFVWCSSNKGIFRINRDNSVLHLTKEDGLQENEFNTNAVVTTEDGEIFFGGINGISSFYPDAIHPTEEKINLLFTGITVNNQQWIKDTAVWNIQMLELPYYQNSLAFDFIAMGNNNPGQYSYQYRMQGIDKVWITNGGLQTVRYFLPPGKYVFQIAASRFFNKDVKPMKELTIIIHPPFWATWWFRLTIALCAIGIIVFSVNRYQRHKYQKKWLALEADQKLQIERERISRELHDDLGTRANMLAYNTSLLDDNLTSFELQTIKDRIQETATDMLQSLRETVWTLKQEAITTEDVWTRFKNFITKMQRTYSRIQFTIIEENTLYTGLNNKKALNTIRILQEAVNNAVKHAQCNHIVCKKKTVNGHVTFIVEDDGIGMNSAALSADTNSGLENMDHRAKDSAMVLSITPGARKGTRVRLQL